MYQTGLFGATDACYHLLQSTQIMECKPRRDRKTVACKASDPCTADSQNRPMTLNSTVLGAPIRTWLG